VLALDAWATAVDNTELNACALLLPEMFICMGYS
jgi:hypothetical protein